MSNPLIRRALPKEDQDNQELFDRVRKIYLSRYAARQQGQNQALSRNRQFTFPMQQRRCIDCGGFPINRMTSRRSVCTVLFPSNSFRRYHGTKEKGSPKKPDPAGRSRGTASDRNRIRKIRYMSGDTWVDMQTAQKQRRVNPPGVLSGFETRQELEDNHADDIAANVKELTEIIFK